MQINDFFHNLNISNYLTNNQNNGKPHLAKFSYYRSNKSKQKPWPLPVGPEQTEPLPHKVGRKSEPLPLLVGPETEPLPLLVGPETKPLPWPDKQTESKLQLANRFKDSKLGDQPNKVT